MADLIFDIKSEGTAHVIAVTGEVDMATAPRLIECLQDRSDRDVILDFAGVAFIDSRGIAALLKSHKTLRARGRSLRITAEPDNVRKVLEVTGVDAVLHGAADL
jgi:anti-anti-sigma factor